LFVWLACLSCTKVVNVAVPNASTQLVIQGNVTNAAGPYQVTINSTVAFTADNSFPAVDGAVVTITDGLGLYDSLVETSSGVYTTQGNWQGQPGNTYTLHVTYNGVGYVGSSTMPQAVKLDSVTFNEITRLKKVVIEAVPNFQDPPGGNYYYQFAETINGVPFNKIFVFDDRLSSGKYIRQPLADDSAHLAVGDNVAVSMYCVDENTYNYFRELAQQQNTGSFDAVLFTDVAPSDPGSNLSGGVLGYFSAHTVQVWQGYVSVP
jgi:Domain of unknown function (DUF4249)